MTRDEAIDFLKEEKFKNVNSKYRRDWNDASDMAIEALQAEPVKHGEWVYNPNAYDYGLPAWECDQCGCINANIPPRIMTKDGKPNYAPVNPNSFSGSNFCPNCGAKMDKE